MRLVLLCLVAAAFGADLAANPIRRIVNILQKMQGEMRAEGERDEELHNKFMCYCQKGAATINKEISDQLSASKEAAAAAAQAAAQQEQLKNDIAQAKSDRADAKQAVKEATSMRKKEAAEFAKNSGDQKTNYDALNKAITAIQKGMGKSFLQARGTMEQLKRIVVGSISVAQTERETVLSFLASPYGDYQAASGEIVGILKAMSDEMGKDLKTMIEEEENAKKNFKELIAAKEAEIATATKAIEEKSVRQGEVAVAATEGKNNAANAEAEAEANRKFLADLDGNCKSAEADYAERQKTRNEEVLAVSEAIKILNDDDALDIFKKTLPTPRAAAPALVQTQSFEASPRVQAVAILQQAASMAPGSTRLQLLAYSLKTGKVDFSKVIKMIDDMVVELGKDQKADDDHLAYCNSEADKNSDTKRTLERDIKDRTAEIDSLEEAMKQLTADMEQVQAEMKETEQQMADATEQRKAENAEYTKEMTELNAAKMILGKAKNRLLKFYNPALYKPPPQRELTEEERIAQNMGEVIPTSTPKMIPGTNIPQLIQKADIGDAPEQGSYKKKSGKSSGVISLMDMLDKDLDKQIQEGEHEEKIAQRDYEELMQASKEALEKGKKTLTTKQGEHAAARENHETASADRADLNDQLMTTNELIAALHKECDFLLQNFEFRKAARAKEIEGLKNAKAVLHGANYE